MFIEGKFIKLNEYTKGNRSNKYGGAKMKKQMGNLIYWQIVNKPKFETPCKIKFVWHIKKSKNGQYHDPDNISFSKKYILDSMQDANIIPDDTFKHIKGFIDEFVISDKEGVEGTVVE